MDYARKYDILWHIVAANGRQAALFGDTCARVARVAFCASATGSAMPIVYLEVPLLGNPRFDVQVCLDRDAVVGGASLPPGAPEVERDLLDWLTSPAGSDCSGVDLAFDLAANGVADPQVIVLMRDGTLADAEGFFSLAGAPDAARRYREAERHVPEGWRTWYTGLIPGRPGSPVRLDYFVSQGRLDAYAHDTTRLARDLELAGYHPSPRQLAWCEELLAYPCGLNIQLDVLEDGTLGPVLGYNLCMGNLGPHQVRQSLEQGWMARACERIKGWGLADARWRRIRELCLGKALHVRQTPDQAAEEWLAFDCRPTFVKVRMTQDELVDAKVYIMCAFKPMESRRAASGASQPAVGPDELG